METENQNLGSNPGVFSSSWLANMKYKIGHLIAQRLESERERELGEDEFQGKEKMAWERSQRKTKERRRKLEDRLARFNSSFSFFFFFAVVKCSAGLPLFLVS